MSALDAVLTSGALSIRDIESMWPVLERFPLPVLWIGADARVAAANRAAREIHGDRLVDSPCAAMCANYPHRPTCFAAKCSFIAAQYSGRVVSVAGARTTRNGEALFNITAVPIEEGGVLKIHDPLADGITQAWDGIYNRSFFCHLATCALASRVGPHQMSSVLLVDVDQLKRINDRFGHAAGDAVVAGVAAAIRKFLRRDDIAGRWGGDEFCVMLPGLSRVAASQLAERLVERVAASRLPDPWSEVRLAVSIGVHSFRGRVEVDKAIEIADLALYRAKRSGGSGISVVRDELAAAARAS